MTQTTHQFREEMQIRSVLTDACERLYILNDIAKCVGYKAPHKFSGRCSYQKEKVEVRWKTGIKCGMSLMWAVNYENYLRIAKAYEFPKEITEFLRVIESGEKKKAELPVPKRNTFQTQGENGKEISSAIDNVMIALLELKKILNT